MTRNKAENTTPAVPSGGEDDLNAVEHKCKDKTTPKAVEDRKARTESEISRDLLLFGLHVADNKGGQRGIHFQ